MRGGCQRCGALPCGHEMKAMLLDTDLYVGQAVEEVSEW
jgi:hypothetical protein